jgi:hypothetical protein
MNMYIIFFVIMIISITIAKKIDDNNDDYTHLFEPVTKQELRGLYVEIKSLEAFKKIHKKVITIAINGGTEHKYKLCFKNHNITKTIDEMMHETFQDSTIESVVIDNCTEYKINW